MGSGPISVSVEPRGHLQSFRAGFIGDQVYCNILRDSNAMDGARPNLRRLFSACDVNKSGKIEYEDFTAVCLELSVPEAHIKTLFDKFDADDDGYIDYGNFSSRFREVSATLDLASLGTGSFQNQSYPWDVLVDEREAEALVSER